MTGVSWDYKTTTAEQTEAFGRLIGEQAYEALVVLLVGPLGAGKTVIARGIARGTGFEGYVRSPTFTLIHHYSGSVPVYHFDLYRLESHAEVEDLGIEEYFFGDGVSVVEWADRIRDYWPEDRLLVNIDRSSGKDETRHLHLQATGDGPIALLDKLRKRVEAGQLAEGEPSR